MAALALAVGCAKSPPGGPGATGNTKTADKDNTFDIRPPQTATDLKPGEKKEVKVSINRGKNFDQTVHLKFEAPRE